MSREETAMLRELADEELGEVVDDFLSESEPIDEIREAEERRARRLKKKELAHKKRVQIFKSIFGNDPNQNGKIRKKLAKIRSEMDYIKHKDSRRLRHSAKDEIRRQLDEQMRTFFEENAEFVRNYELDCN